MVGAGRRIAYSSRIFLTTFYHIVTLYTSSLLVKFSGVPGFPHGSGVFFGWSRLDSMRLIWQNMYAIMTYSIYIYAKLAFS